ncbi:hypothetical protein D3C86_1561450 [compost metagenome]
MVSSPVSATRSATFDFSSRSRRSRSWRLVTNLPSRPASGDVFTQKFMVSVGSSTFSIGRASWASGAHTVQPIPSSSIPLISTMSPASASGTISRSRPRNFSTWLIRPLIGLPSGPNLTTTSCSDLARPREMRPTPILPT